MKWSDIFIMQVCNLRLWNIDIYCCPKKDINCRNPSFMTHRSIWYLKYEFKATTNFSSWISIIPDEPNLRVVPGCSKCFKNCVWFWKFNIYCIYSSARVCNKASIIEPTTNVFLACWKFITLSKLTQLSLLFKVIKHLE